MILEGRFGHQIVLPPTWLNKTQAYPNPVLEGAGGSESRSLAPKIRIPPVDFRVRCRFLCICKANTKGAFAQFTANKITVFVSSSGQLFIIYRTSFRWVQFRTKRKLFTCLNCLPHLWCARRYPDTQRSARIGSYTASVQLFLPPSLT